MCKDPKCTRCKKTAQDLGVNRPVVRVEESTKPIIEKGKLIMSEIVNDIKVFVREQKGVIYTVLFIALVDHLFLGGTLRERLKTLFSNLLDKAEDSIKVK